MGSSTSQNVEMIKLIPISSGTNVNWFEKKMEKAAVKTGPIFLASTYL